MYPINSVASVVRASSGRATPNVSPAAEEVSSTVQVSKMMPVSGSVYFSGVVDWARHGWRTALLS